MLARFYVWISDQPQYPNAVGDLSAHSPPVPNVGDGESPGSGISTECERNGPGAIVFAVVFFAVKFFADEIEHAFREQEKLVQTDSLTGLFNGRYIRQHASKLLSHCDRYGHPLSIMCLQIDHFNTISGVHGDAVALQAVQHLARLLAQDVRDADILARTAGAHFVLLMPETVLEEAHQSAKRLRENVESVPLPLGERKLPLSLSIGLSYCESNSMLSMDHLIECANIALQQAQLEGGNMIRQQLA